MVTIKGAKAGAAKNLAGGVPGNLSGEEIDLFFSLFSGKMYLVSGF
jgi:hypothetical protein